jgi:hypothetical protein
MLYATALHNDTLLLYAASFYSTGHPVFSKSRNNSVATNTNLAEEEVVVMLVDKFGVLISLLH